MPRHPAPERPAEPAARQDTELAVLCPSPAANSPVPTSDLATRADMTVDDVECIEEGGTEPTIALLRLLAAALDSDVRLTPWHDLGSVWFEPHAS